MTSVMHAGKADFSTIHAYIYIPATYVAIIQCSYTVMYTYIINVLYLRMHLVNSLYRYSPGASPYALTVGGTQRNDNLYLRLFDGTNYGKCVDIFAPGQDVVSAGIRSRDAVSTLSGTSQATPIVSGAAAIYWNINKNATAADIKNIINSTCIRNRLKIKSAVPPSFADNSPNCLIFINNSYHKENLPYYVFHSVPSSKLKAYIKDMEENFYILIYIHSHLINSSVHYSLIFKYTGYAEFNTVMVANLNELKSAVRNYETDGYQVTLIYSMKSADHIVVFEKTTLIYSHRYKLRKKQHDKLYRSKSSQSNSLLSTTIVLTKRGPRYTSVYVQNSDKTRHLSNVRNSIKLAKALDVQLNREYYLSHLTTIPTKPPSYAVVFRKMTKPSTNYVMSKDLKLNEVGEIVHMQVSKGFTPLVIAGLDTPSGLKFVVSFEL